MEPGVADAWTAAAEQWVALEPLAQWRLTAARMHELRGLLYWSARVEPKGRALVPYIPGLRGTQRWDNLQRKWVETEEHNHPWGTCVWCRQATTYVESKTGEIKVARRRWHEGCVEAFQIAKGYQAYGNRAFVRGPCENCGAPGTETDHVMPLWKAKALGDRRILLRAYTIGNLQSLCHGCHAAKTAREAAERAAMRRRETLETAPNPQTRLAFGSGSAP